MLHLMISNAICFYNSLLQNLLPSDKVKQDDWVIIKAAYLIIVKFDLSVV